MPVSTSRRGFLAGLAALVAAPAIIRTSGLLMPIKPQPLFVSSLQTVENFFPEPPQEAFFQAAFNTANEIVNLAGKWQVPLEMIYKNPNLVEDLTRLYGTTVTQGWSMQPKFDERGKPYKERRLRDEERFADVSNNQWKRIKRNDTVRVYPEDVPMPRSIITAENSQELLERNELNFRPTKTFGV